MTWAVTALVLAAAVQAAPSHQLTYARDGAEACPDEAALRRAVAERLGSDPFGPEAPLTVAVRMARRGDLLTADIRLLDAPGAVRGARQLSSTSRDCAELARATALAVAIIIDPMVLARPEPPPPAALPPPAPPPEQPTVEVRAPLRPMPAPQPPSKPERPQLVEAPPAPEPPSAVYAAAGAALTIGQTPTATAALQLDGTWETERWMLGGRVTVSAPGGTTVSGGAVQAMTVDAGPLGCARLGRVGACLWGRFGVTQAWAVDLAGALGPKVAPAAAVGLQPFFDLPLGDRVRLRLCAAVQLNLVTAVLDVGPREVWRTSLVSFWLGASLALRAFGQHLP